MDASLLAMVLLAASLHAGWNLLVKLSTDRLAMTTMLVLVAGLISAVAIPLLPLPAAPSWPFIGAGVILHSAYTLLLVQAYRHGDFGHVYPIARGTAPVLVLAVSTTLIGEQLNALEVAGIVVISAGIASLVLADLPRRKRSLGAAQGSPTDAGSGLKPVLYALACGVAIAGYTVVDGMGARLSGAAYAYIFWLFAADSLPMAAIILIRRRRAAFRALRSEWPRGLVAAMMALAAYWLVVQALSLAPMGPVAALRETSVVLAALLGTLVLKERLGPYRVAAAAIVAGGLVLLRL